MPHPFPSADDAVKLLTFTLLLEGVQASVLRRIIAGDVKQLKLSLGYHARLASSTPVSILTSEASSVRIPLRHGLTGWMALIRM
jgi:hypothetical protein